MRHPSSRRTLVGSAETYIQARVPPREAQQPYSVHTLCPSTSALHSCTHEREGTDEAKLNLHHLRDREVDTSIVELAEERVKTKIPDVKLCDDETSVYFKHF